jgi:hypothetical protein
MRLKSPDADQKKVKVMNKQPQSKPSSTPSSPPPRNSALRLPEGTQLIADSQTRRLSNPSTRASERKIYQYLSNGNSLELKGLLAAESRLRHGKLPLELLLMDEFWDANPLLSHLLKVSSEQVLLL